MWLSPVECLVRDQEAAGSNPVTPITKGRFGVLFCYRNKFDRAKDSCLSRTNVRDQGKTSIKIARWAVFAKFFRTAQGVERTAVSYTTMRRRWASLAPRRRVQNPVISEDVRFAKSQKDALASFFVIGIIRSGRGFLLVTNQREGPRRAVPLPQG